MRFYLDELPVYERFYLDELPAGDAIRPEAGDDLRQVDATRQLEGRLKALDVHDICVCSCWIHLPHIQKANSLTQCTASP